MRVSSRTLLSRLIRLAPLLPLTAVAALVGVAPFLAALRGSFLHDIYGRIDPAGLDNYRFILGDRAFLYSLKITVLWAFLHTVITVGIGGTLAFRIWRSNRRRRWLTAAVFIPWGVPVYIAVPVWRAVIHGDGEIFNLLTQPVTAFIATLMVSVWLSIPAAVFLFHAGLKKVGRRLIEAAVLDGADTGQIFSSICVPLLRDLGITFALIEFVKGLKEFSVVFLMTAGGPPLLSGITERHIVGATTTLSLFLYDLFISSEDFGVTSAFSVLVASTVLAATLYYLFAGRSTVNVNRTAGTSRTPILFTMLAQLLTGGAAALPVAALYCVCLFRRRLFGAAVALHAAVSITLLAVQGFPGGLQPALFLGLLSLAVLRGPSSSSTTRPTLRLWQKLEGMIASGAVAAGLLMAAALIWLSLSGLDAVSFRSLIPPAPGLRSFRLAFGEERILRYFLNSLIVASATALLLPLITLPAARAVSGMSRRGEGAVLTTIQLLGTVSGMHALVPLFIIFRHLGLINSYTGLVLIYLEHAFVFSLFTLSSYLRDLPASLHEAARLEGAGQVYYLLRIVAPLCRPIIFTTMAVAFLGAWNGFMPALLFIRDDWKYTIGVKIFSLVGNGSSGAPRWSVFAAVSLINMLVLGVLLYLTRGRGMSSALADSEE